MESTNNGLSMIPDSLSLLLNKFWDLKQNRPINEDAHQLHML